MSVIIRLQGLPWSANAMDIRRFFQSLGIPEGGVHIVGGESGDAFIAFSTDEDARQAMLLDGGKIKDSRLKLMLSSRIEMQKVIEAARSRNISLQAGVIGVSNNSNVVPSNTVGAMGIMGNATSNISPSLPGSLNITSSPFDIQAPQPQLVYVNRMALEQQQQQNAPQKQSNLVADYSGASGIPPTGSVASGSFGGLKSDHNREKDGGRMVEGGRRSSERERDRDRTKTRGRRRDRSRSPRKSRDRGGDDAGYRRRSGSRDDDKVRRGNNADRFRDLDVRQEVSAANNGESDNNSVNRFNEPPQSNRRGPSRWSRASSPVQSQQKRDVEPCMVSDVTSGGLPLGAQQIDMQGAWAEKPGGNMMRPSMNNEQNFVGFGGGQRNLSPPRGTLVVVRGVAFNTMPVHIRDFFTGLSITSDGIHFAVDSRGERLPVVFVRFASERDRDLALRRPKLYLNNCMVEVHPSSEDELRAAIGPNNLLSSPPLPNRPSDNNMNNSINNRYCVVLQGLPMMVREGDVVRFLAGFNIKDVLIKYDSMGKTTGVCFVELSDPGEAERCLEMNGQMLGPRHIEINLIDKEEMEIQKTESRENRSGGNQFGGEFMRNSQGSGFNARETEQSDPDCCLVRGLPFNADNRDVYDFFAPSGCTPTAIHLMKDDNNCAIGDAVCEFSNRRQCSIALRLDGAPLRPGSRAFLMIKPISRKELEDAILSTCNPNVNNNSFNRAGGGGGGSGGGLNTTQQRSNDSKFGLLGSNPEGRFPGTYQGPTFNNGSRYNNASGAQQSMNEHDDNRGGMMEDGPHSRNSGGRRSPQQMQQQFNRFQGAPSKFGRQSEVVVEVTNIPYRASTEDLLDFFKEFNVNEDDVLRRINNRGQPTGDARITFKSAEFAQTAVRRLRNQSIMGRTITMNIL